jgi:hypothetical protein
MREIRVIAYQQFLESYRVRLAGWQTVGHCLPLAQQLLLDTFALAASLSPS